LKSLDFRAFSFACLKLSVSDFVHISCTALSFCLFGRINHVCDQLDYGGERFYDEIREESDPFPCEPGAIIWYVTLHTSSGAWVSALTVAAYVPQFAISFFSGVWADRYPRKRLIILSDSVIALAMLVLALLPCIIC